MPNFKQIQTACLFIFIFLISFPEKTLSATQLGPQTKYTSQDVADAIRSSTLNDTLKQSADHIGNLAMFESSGNAGISNGCCSGILQVHQMNHPGMTSQQFANLPLQQQVNVWADLQNKEFNSAPVKALRQMQQNGQSIQGYGQVDQTLMIACVQIGTGNCQKVIQAGTCETGAGTDGNGKSVCDFANAMKTGKSNPYNNNENNQSEKENANSGSDKGGKPDISPTECWACEGAAIVLKATDSINQITQNLIKDNLEGLIKTLFSIIIIIQILKGIINVSKLKIYPLWWMAIRFTIIITIFNTGDFYRSYINPYLLSPSIQAGAEIGTRLSNITSSTLNANKPSGSCNYRQQNLSGDTGQSAKKIIDLICSVNLTINEGIAKVSAATRNIQGQDSSRRGIAVQAILGALTNISIASLWFAMLVFGGQIIEALIRLCIYTAAMPYVAIIWIFQQGKKRSGRTLPANILKGFLYASMLLAISGAITGITLYILNVGLQHAGVGNSSGKPDGIGVGQAAIMIIHCIVSGIMASKLIQSAPNIASLFAAHSTAAATQVSGSIAAGVSSGFSTATGIGSLAAGTTAGGLGVIMRGAKDGIHRLRTNIKP